MKKRLTYKDAGVDIDAGEELVSRIKGIAGKGEGIVESIGGFGAGFLVPSGYRQPVIVCGTDGVGTKLEVLRKADAHEVAGIDLVAMCVNDVLATGAKPLYFLDYFATGRLSVDVAERVIRGIVKGCEMAGCTLIGGETAEMPGFYPEGVYDLAGFAIGIVERDAYITGERIKEGDVILGLASSGIHSNGYSLVRKALFEVLGLKLEDFVPELGVPLKDVLTVPTRIYVPSILSLLERVRVSGLVHVTGGGIPGNVKRVLKRGVDAVIEKGSWEVPRIFKFIQEKCGVPEEEMFKTFNMGIGYCVILAEEDAGRAEEILSLSGEKVYRIGRIVKGEGRVLLR